MQKNQQEAEQMMSETFTGKAKDYLPANRMDPSADVETRVPSTQNDKGSS